MNKSLKKNKGITIIALIVAVVIILILAGISIKMIMSDNGIISMADNASSQAKNTNDEQAVRMAALSVMMRGSLTLEKLQSELNKTRSGDFIISEEEGIITVSFTGGKSFDVNKQTGDVGLTPPSIRIGNVKVVNSSGTEVEKNTASANDTLYIKFTASIEDGKITSVKYNGTETLTADSNGVYTKQISKNGKYSFDIVGTAEGKEYSLNDYIVAVKQYYVEEYTTAQIANSITTFTGKYVTNYTSRNNEGIDAAEKQKWQICYADTNNIYIISSKLVKINNLPAGRNGKLLKKSNTSEVLASWGDIATGVKNTDEGATEELIAKNYVGAADIINPDAESYPISYSNRISITALNSQFLEAYSVSTNKNMKGVAYMCDADIWTPAFTDNKTISKVDYVIGGPTIELMFKLCNSTYSSNIQYRKENGKEKYQADGTTNKKGYLISKDGGTNWSYTYSDMIAGYMRANTGEYWLASPSGGDDLNMMSIDIYGKLKFRLI